MSNLHLRFEADLPYQHAAVRAVTDLFSGQPMRDSALSVSFSAGAMLQSELGLGNALAITNDQMLHNLQTVQHANGLPESNALLAREFAVEMETGTGKTYVYLRTAYELRAQYGFSKFVIVVPSVAIREGVSHALRATSDHFKALYNVAAGHFVYDSDQPGKARQFALADTLTFAVINIQNFIRDVDPDNVKSGANRMFIEQDRLSGRRPIDYFQATHPIVIVDEPQKMDGEKSRAAIDKLNPLCTLNYSATYEHPNKIFRLGPIEAAEQRLVKQVEVASITADDNLNEAFVELVGLDLDKSAVRLKINKRVSGKVSQRPVTARHGDDLFLLSGEREEYRHGFRISEIDFARELVSFSGGLQLTPARAEGGFDEDVTRQMIRETVREHLQKERVLRPLGIKVLSLFFIDHVASYREHQPDGGWRLGRLGQWFEETLAAALREERYAGLIQEPVAAVHNGYFAKDKRGNEQDSRESRATKADTSAYELIMRDKERLLSFDEPLRFIFSHSALREGWDNPNVFQICSLRESPSDIRRRQEIGRGLRLPVNQLGERVRDEHVNRLTVVARESYRAFAKGLQTEYEQEAGIRFGVVKQTAFAAVLDRVADEIKPLGDEGSRAVWKELAQNGVLDREGRVQQHVYDTVRDRFAEVVPVEHRAAAPAIQDHIERTMLGDHVRNARDRRAVRRRKEVIADPAFLAFWRTIAKRTRYRINLDSAVLTREAAARIRMMPRVTRPGIQIETSEIVTDSTGIHATTPHRLAFAEIDRSFPIPDVLTRLQNSTELTRRTLAKILVDSGRAEELRVNPHVFLDAVEHEINAAKRDLILPGITYEETGREWTVDLLTADAEEGLIRYLNNLYTVQNEWKCPFDHVELQSNIERAFVEHLDADDAVKFFLKLPAAFTIDTPLGTYNPDWAILREENGGRKLYFVRETKGSLDPDDLRGGERGKIHCARAHFAAIGVDFAVTTSWQETVRGLSG